MKIPQNKIKSLRHILYLRARENNAIRVTLSGIVESPQPTDLLSKSEPKPESQNDFVELTKSCMERMDAKTLGAVFSIFSEIEKNKELALPVLAMINEYNESTNDETDEDEIEE